MEPSSESTNHSRRQRIVKAFGQDRSLQIFIHPIKEHFDTLIGKVYTRNIHKILP